MADLSYRIGARAPTAKQHMLFDRLYKTDIKTCREIILLVVLEIYFYSLQAQINL